MKLGFRFQTGHQGFGLLETLFSTAVFIVVVGGMVTLGRLSLRNAALAAHRTQAINLAQDGIESIRQMRDTGWIARRASSAGLPPTDDWLTYYITDRHNRANPSECASGTGRYRRPEVYQAGVKEVEYELCIKKDQKNVNEFGLRLVNAAEPASPIVLKTSDGQADPGSPLGYRRLIRFESVPPTTGVCSGQAPPATTGLELLGLDPNSNICTVSNYESFAGQPLYAVKVVSKVVWNDFDRDWDVSVESILVNWRGR